jgi:hypothetical protein
MAKYMIVLLPIAVITACMPIGDMSIAQYSAVEPDENNSLDIPQEEQSMEPILSLQPIPVYPAYFVNEAGTIFGLPSEIQGSEQKVKIDLIAKDQEGNEIAVTVRQFFSKDGKLYFRVEYMEQEQFFAQQIGTDMIEEIAEEDFPTEPESTRQIVNMPEFSIKQAEYNGEQVSEIWNLNPLYVSEKTPNGAGPFRFGMVDAYRLMDNGLLFNAVGVGLRFIPFNRTAVNVVSESGRMWK